MKRRGKTLWWEEGQLRLLDQTKLPHEVAVIACANYRQVAQAIKEMRVRGAPAIGVAAAFGVALAALDSSAKSKEQLLADLETAANVLRATRPTAVNLFWALERVLRAAQPLPEARADAEGIRQCVLAEAERMAQEDEAANRKIGAYGAELLRDGATVLTHCNAGALATVGYGTALGVVRAAWEQGKRVSVLATETRPFLQGARLTAWELQQEGIPVTLITDSMAGHFMKGAVDLVLVGADRIAANGDLANKIGTYTLAVLAKENGVPFYSAAPTSTIDLSIPSGDAIPIEERSREEVLYFAGVRIAPEGVSAGNPAFDITPHRFIIAIITEKGLVRPPYSENLRRAVEGNTG